MTSPLTAFIEETERLYDEATPGPWECYGNPEDGIDGVRSTIKDNLGIHLDIIGNSIPYEQSGCSTTEDAKFIAESRTRLPQALAALKVAVEAIERYTLDGVEGNTEMVLNQIETILNPKGEK